VNNDLAKIREERRSLIMFFLDISSPNNRRTARKPSADSGSRFDRRKHISNTKNKYHYSAILFDNVDLTGCITSTVACCSYTVHLHYVGAETLTAVVMKSSIFWDITPCSPLNVIPGFGGTCHLLQAGFLLGLSFSPEDGGDMFLPNVG
jgi:hypothetical protein